MILYLENCNGDEKQFNLLSLLNKVLQDYLLIVCLDPHVGKKPTTLGNKGLSVEKQPGQVPRT